MLDLSAKQLARFFAKVNRNGPVPAHCPELGPCHEWHGATNGKGYGQMNLASHGHLYVHRLAFFLAHGRWPEPCALHHCDNRRCVNDAHLFEGTNADNLGDMARKGRARGGRPKGTGHALSVRSDWLRLTDAGWEATDHVAERLWPVVR